MKHTKKNNLISDEQLLLFGDAIASGASFDKAFADAGFFLSDKKEYKELQTFFKLEEMLRGARVSIEPPASLLDNILAKFSLSMPPTSPLGAVHSDIKSPYVSTLDHMVQMVAHPTWKIAAPIAVMFLALSTMLGVGTRRDAASIIPRHSLTTTNSTEAPLAMNTNTLDSISISMNAVPQPSHPPASPTSVAANQKMMVVGTGESAISALNVAESTPESLDGVFAMLSREADDDINLSRQGDEDIAADAPSVSVLVQSYDETTI